MQEPIKFSNGRIKLGDGLYELIHRNVTSPNGEVKSFFNSTIQNFFIDNPAFVDYIRLHGKITGLRDVAMLAAYGNANGKLTYSDGNTEVPVQDWITDVDGKNAGLLLRLFSKDDFVSVDDKELSKVYGVKLASGNQETFQLTHGLNSEKSVIIIPDRMPSNPLHYGEISYTLIAPGINEEITSENIQKHLKRLESRL